MNAGRLVLWLVMLAASLEASAQVLQPLNAVVFDGAIKADKDISAIAQRAPFLIIGADEGVGPNRTENIVQVLKRQDTDRYAVDHAIRLFDGNDEEGIAMADGWLYLGFRGPVLRDNYVPVLRLDFDEPDDHELLFVNLDGYGIRDITRVADGFLIVAGPVGDGPGGYSVYYWDGHDVVPGRARDEPVGHLTRLGELQAPQGGKAEGITVLQEDAAAFECLVVFDGVAAGAAQRVRLPKP